MNTLGNINPRNNSHSQSSIFRKTTLALYGILSYAIGFSGILAIIFAAGGFLPLGKNFVFTNNTLGAVTINVALTGLFGLQHSVMARQGFKQLFNSIFGQAVERSTFVWTSGVCSLMVIMFWQTVDGTAWQLESPALRALMWMGFACGWTYLVAATFAINHWESITKIKSECFLR